MKTPQKNATDKPTQTPVAKKPRTVPRVKVSKFRSCGFEEEDEGEPSTSAAPTNNVRGVLKNRLPAPSNPFVDALKQASTAPKPVVQQPVNKVQLVTPIVNVAKTVILELPPKYTHDGGPDPSRAIQNSEKRRVYFADDVGKSIVDIREIEQVRNDFRSRHETAEMRRVDAAAEHRLLKDAKALQYSTTPDVMEDGLEYHLTPRKEYVEFAVTKELSLEEKNRQLEVMAVFSVPGCVLDAPAEPDDDTGDLLPLSCVIPLEPHVVWDSEDEEHCHLWPPPPKADYEFPRKRGLRKLRRHSDYIVEPKSVTSPSYDAIDSLLDVPCCSDLTLAPCPLMLEHTKKSVSPVPERVSDRPRTHEEFITDYINRPIQVPRPVPPPVGQYNFEVPTVASPMSMSRTSTLSPPVTYSRGPVVISQPSPRATTRRHAPGCTGVPCRFFMTRSCRYGEMCYFLHANPGGPSPAAPHTVSCPKAYNLPAAAPESCSKKQKSKSSSKKKKKKQRSASRSPVRFSSSRYYRESSRSSRYRSPEPPMRPRSSRSRSRSISTDSWSPGPSHRRHESRTSSRYESSASRRRRYDRRSSSRSPSPYRRRDSISRSPAYYRRRYERSLSRSPPPHRRRDPRSSSSSPPPRRQRDPRSSSSSLPPRRERDPRSSSSSLPPRRERDSRSPSRSRSPSPRRSKRHHEDSPWSPPTKKSRRSRSYSPRRRRSDSPSSATPS